MEGRASGFLFPPGTAMANKLIAPIVQILILSPPYPHGAVIHSDWAFRQGSTCAGYKLRETSVISWGMMYIHTQVI